MGFRQIEQPRTLEERCTLARRSKDELELPIPFLIDTMADLSRALFGDLPHSAVIVSPDGSIFEKLPWADPELLDQAVTRCLAAARASAATGYGTAQHALLLGDADALQRLEAVFAAAETIPRDRALAARSLALSGCSDAELWRERAETAARALWGDEPERLEAFLLRGE